MNEETQPLDEVRMSTATFHKLFKDATRWRAFESATHLQITDFDQRESGCAKPTKQRAVDRLIRDETVPT